MSTEATEVVEQSGQTETAALEGENLEAQNTPGETAESGEVETKQEEPAKTFTQAEVDALIQKRLLKEERRVHRRIEQQLREQQQVQVLKNEPKRESFADDEAFIKAQVEHLAEVKAAEKLAAQRRAEEAERRNESFNEKAEKAVERYPDFHAVVNNPMLPINDDMAEFITESDLGAEVAYYLGKNQTKAAEIAGMSAVKAARELARIESELAARPKATVSNAPEPINPVGTRGKSTASALPSDSDDIETWMRKENERMQKRYR